jgi:hypothetical protein
VGRGGCRTQAATSLGEMQRLGIDMKHEGLMQEHAGGWPVCRKPVSPSTIARGLIGCGPGPGHDVGVPGGCYSFRRVDAASNHLPATHPTSPFPQQQNYLLLQSSREVTLHATHLLHSLTHPFFLSTQETSDHCCHSAYPRPTLQERLGQEYRQPPLNFYTLDTTPPPLALEHPLMRA